MSVTAQEWYALSGSDVKITSNFVQSKRSADPASVVRFVRDETPKELAKQEKVVLQFDSTSY